VSLFTISNLKDKSTIFMLHHYNQLSNNLSLDFSLAFFKGEEDTIFGPEALG